MQWFFLAMAMLAGGGLAIQATINAELGRGLGHPVSAAMVSFAVRALDGLPVDFIQPPAPLYDGRRAATFVGPAGELTELIELGDGGEW